MSAYIKYFEKGGKSMSFMIKNDDGLTKYNNIWNKILKTLSLKFHSQPVYDGKYVEAKLKEFNGVGNINFLGD